MDISSISTATLRSLLTLTEKRDALLAQLAKVDSEIAAAYASDKAKAPTTGARRGRKPKAVAPVAAKPESEAKSTVKTAKKARKGRKGGIKEVIVAALQGAGAKGISVKDLSAKAGVKAQNIHVWLATTGKNVGIEKVSPGIYRLKA